MCYASHFDVPLVNSVYNRTENISFLGPKISDILPIKIKGMKKVDAFKGWKPEKWKKWKSEIALVDFPSTI